MVAVSLARSQEVDFAALLGLGVEHFRSGSDHLVFLTLVAAGTALTRRTTGRSVRGLAVRTGAFTVGHSASLALAVAGVIDPPASVIEPAIAVTILPGAVHLMRPLVSE